MKRAIRTADEMRLEYDFSAGVRGKYANRYARGTNVVLLEPDAERSVKAAPHPLDDVAKRSRKG